MNSEEQKNPANEKDVFGKVEEAMELLNEVVKLAIKQSYKNGIATGKRGFRRPNYTR